MSPSRPSRIWPARPRWSACVTSCSDEPSTPPDARPPRRRRTRLRSPGWRSTHRRWRPSTPPQPCVGLSIGSPCAKMDGQPQRRPSHASERPCTTCWSTPSSSRRLRAIRCTGCAGGPREPQRLSIGGSWSIPSRHAPCSTRCATDYSRPRGLLRLPVLRRSPARRGPGVAPRGLRSPRDRLGAIAAVAIPPAAPAPPGPTDPRPARSAGSSTADARTRRSVPAHSEPGRHAAAPPRPVPDRSGGPPRSLPAPARAGVPLAPPYAALVSAETIYRVWAAARSGGRSRSSRPTRVLARSALRPASCLPVHLAQRWRAPGTEVAEWAGHSVEVLLRIYANCVDGDDQIALTRITEALQ